MRLSIPPSNGKRSLRNIERRHLRLQQGIRQNNSNRTRTCANVCNSQRPIMRHTRKQSLNQVLGLRTRNQNVRTDNKRKPIKLLLPQNVLDRFMRSAAQQPFFILRLLLRGNFAVRMGQQKSTVALDGVQEKQFGITTRLR